MTRGDEKREASSGRQLVVRSLKKLNNFLTALERVPQMISAEEFKRRYAHSKSKLVFHRYKTFAEQEYQEIKTCFESTRGVERPLYATRGAGIRPDAFDDSRTCPIQKALEDS